MSDIKSELIRLLEYDSVTGHFRWRAARSNVKAGALAGSIGNHGYWEIRINNRLYLAHRLAWLYQNGEWPEYTIDHIDGNPLNNSLSNLRCATKAENNINRPQRRDNKSGYKGVFWSKSSSKWTAQICVNGRRRHLGVFATAEEAHGAYCAAGRKAFGAFFHPGVAP